MTELKVVATPQGSITFNYAELREEVSAAVAEYKDAVYTPETIGNAKADRAKLNKFKTALNDERIRREKEWMLPFNEFKAQVNEIIKLVDGPIAAIDEQIKTVENAEKEEKRSELKAFYDSIEHPAWLTFSSIENPKWGNKTFSLEAAKDEIEATVSRVVSDLQMIENYSCNPSVARLHYMENRDFGKACDYARQFDEVERAAIPAKKEEAEEQATWITFSALLTVTQAKALKAFFDNNKITFRKGE
jgi:hypothetical protein